MRLHDKQRRRLAASQVERAERALGSAAASSSADTTAAPAPELPDERPRPVEYTFPYAVEQVVEQA